jgi:hypothetical protein
MPSSDVKYDRAMCLASRKARRALPSGHEAVDHGQQPSCCNVGVCHVKLTGFDTGANNLAEAGEPFEGQRIRRCGERAVASSQPPCLPAPGRR